MKEKLTKLERMALNNEYYKNRIYQVRIEHELEHIYSQSQHTGKHYGSNKHFGKLARRSYK